MIKRYLSGALYWVWSKCLISKGELNTEWSEQQNFSGNVGKENVVQLELLKYLPMHHAIHQTSSLNHKVDAIG